MAMVNPVPDFSPVQFEERLRREAAERDDAIQSQLRAVMDELNGVKAEMNDRLAEEQQKRYQAEQEARSLTEEVCRLRAVHSNQDMLADSPRAKLLEEEYLHAAAPANSDPLDSSRSLGRYESLDDMSSGALADAEFEYKTIAEDMWGIAIMLMVRDLSELRAGGASSRNSHLIRFAYAGVCVILNLVLQLGVLRYVGMYIVGNSVWTIQNQYALFRQDVFAKDGSFQTEAWNKWDGPRDELCDAVITKKLFLGCVLFLWIGRCCGEFKMCMRLIREIGSVPEAPSGVTQVDCMLSGRRCDDAGKPSPDDYEIIALTTCTRMGIILFVAVPKIAVCLLLGTMGVTWLAATLSFSDLILNALALEFIIDIDENILNFFLPARIINRLSKTQFAIPKSPNNGDPEAEEKAIIADYMRNITYFVACLVMTPLYVLYFQQVLPYHNFDIEAHCGGWYMNQFSPKCLPFEKNCFPYGKDHAPHDYSEMKPGN